MAFCSFLILTEPRSFCCSVLPVFFFYIQIPFICLNFKTRRINLFQYSALRNVDKWQQHDCGPIPSDDVWVHSCVLGRTVLMPEKIILCV